MFFPFLFRLNRQEQAARLDSSLGVFPCTGTLVSKLQCTKNFQSNVHTLDFSPKAEK